MKIPRTFASTRFGSALKRSIRYGTLSGFIRPLSEARRIYRGTRPVATRICPCCQLEGYFEVYGTPPRLDARCPKCRSLERHRHFYLGYKRGLLTKNGEKLLEPILHFAPEPIIQELLNKEYETYQTADLSKKCDLQLNIEDIAIADESIGTVIANHVLEHVNDRNALKEISRILVPNGLFIASVPIIEGWKHTYENSQVASSTGRKLHFGQHDHVRYYGRDFRVRVQNSGFELDNEITSEGPDVARYGLLRGQKIFVFRKSIARTDS